MFKIKDIQETLSKAGDTIVSTVQQSKAEAGKISIDDIKAALSNAEDKIVSTVQAYTTVSLQSVKAELEKSKLPYKQFDENMIATVLVSEQYHVETAFYVLEREGDIQLRILPRIEYGSVNYNLLKALNKCSLENVYFNVCLDEYNKSILLKAIYPALEIKSAHLFISMMIDGLDVVDELYEDLKAYKVI